MYLSIIFLSLVTVSGTGIYYCIKNKQKLQECTNDCIETLTNFKYKESIKKLFNEEYYDYDYEDDELEIKYDDANNDDIGDFIFLS